jgi:hypothetical protein
MTALSTLFLFSAFAPAIAAAMIGRGSGQFANFLVTLIAHWIVLGVGMYVASLLSRGIFPVIVGFAITGVFLIAVVNKKFP